jgi:Transposase IS200 like
MPSTHLSLHYHIIFSTKGPRRVIANTWRDNLHAYIGGIIGDMNAVPSAIGGPGDHAHVRVATGVPRAGPGCASGCVGLRNRISSDRSGMRLCYK